MKAQIDFKHLIDGIDIKNILEKMLNKDFFIWNKFNQLILLKKVSYHEQNFVFLS